jgi:hypothetical protein
MIMGDAETILLQWFGFPDSWTLLNDSSSQFIANETLETIVPAMFINSWMSNVSYEMFFNNYAPSHCSFTYRYRFDFLDLLSTFLSVYSGLSMTLRFVIPRLFRIIEKFRKRWRVTPLQ